MIDRLHATTKLVTAYLRSHPDTTSQDVPRIIAEIFHSLPEGGRETLQALEIVHRAPTEPVEDNEDTKPIAKVLSFSEALAASRARLGHG